MMGGLVAALNRTFRLPNEAEVSLTDAGHCETIRIESEVQLETANCDVGGCRLSGGEWVGGLFPGGQQRPSDRIDCVRTCPADLPYRDFRRAPDERLPGYRGKCRHVRHGRRGSRSRAATAKTLKLIRTTRSGTRFGTDRRRIVN